MVFQGGCPDPGIPEWAHRHNCFCNILNYVTSITLHISLLVYIIHCFVDHKPYPSSTVSILYITRAPEGLQPILRHYSFHRSNLIKVFFCNAFHSKANPCFYQVHTKFSGNSGMNLTIFLARNLVQLLGHLFIFYIYM